MKRVLIFFVCIISGSTLLAMKKEVLPKSLISTSQLPALGLCPLYPRFEKFEVDGETYNNMLPVKFKRLGSWDTQLVDKENALKLMPCVKQGKDFERDELSKKLGTTNALITNRIIMQLKTINQNEASQGTAMCAGLSLRNSVLMYDYARTGDNSFLEQLPNMKLSLNFLEKNGCVRWVDPELIPNWVEKAGVPLDNFSVIPTVFLLEERYHKDPIIAYSFEEEKLREILKLRRKIAADLASDKFFHTFIIGDYEVAQQSGGRGHYFSFSIFKVGTTVEYVVADTQVENYHLRQGSYEYARLLYLIDLLETGVNRDKSSPLLDLYKDTPVKKN